MEAIEIFRPGSHTAMSGEALQFGESDLRKSAEAYDPQLHEAPIVVGHPKTDQPAYGWVGALDYVEGALQAKPTQVDEQFAEVVKSGRYKKVSASFYRPDSPSNPSPGVWYLRHVGFLGAQPPAVKGLKQVEFSGHDQGVVEIEFGEAERTLSRVLRGLREWIIEMAGVRRADDIVPEYRIKDLEMEPETDPGFSENTEQEDEQLSKEEKERIKQEARREMEAEFAEREQKLKEAEAARKRAEREDAVDRLVSQGKVLPRHKEGLLQFMEATESAGEAVVEFGENKEQLQPAQWLKRFLEDLPQAVDYSERSGDEGGESPSGSYEMPDGYSADPDKIRLHGQALEYQEKHNCDYVTAVNAVAGQGGK